MSSFAIKYPFFILMFCLMVVVVGVTTVVRMPVDLFPEINIPVVVVATFYSGMPPQQIEADITDSYERFFTLGSNINHIESRSLPGVSLIKIYFQPGTDANSAVSNISNLAMANLRRLPPGTLPPVVLKFDASNLPVCLVTLEGQGLNQTQLKDLAQFAVRNQIANVPGASVPQPYGGKYRQIQIYVDPVKLEAHQLSVMDVVRSVNESNLILPAGDVRIGAKDYNIYANSQVPVVDEINALPIKTDKQDHIGESVLVGDVGKAEDAGQLQYNIVRVDGQHSVYIPVLKQGGGFQHHQHREWDSRRREASAGRSLGAADQCRLRPVGLRQARGQERHQRRNHGTDSDGADDPAVSGQSARDRQRAALDSNLLPGDLHRSRSWSKHDQHDGARRPRPCALPSHR